MTDEATVWNPENSCVFHRTRDKWGEFSNMHKGFPLQVGGLRVGSTEALYQACKFPDHEDVQAAILDASTPMLSKRVAYSYADRSQRPDWDQVKVAVMTWCVALKSLQHPSFAALLIETGTRDIVEHGGKRQDTFWGAVPEGDVFRGRNTLGIVLMGVREAWVERRLTRWSSLKTPLEDMRLLGNPVPTL